MNLKTYTVDIDDPSDLKRLTLNLSSMRNKLLAEKGYKAVTFNSSKLNMDNVLPLLEGIWNADISSLYEKDFSTNYYVYAHCDPRKKLTAKYNLKHLFLALKFPNIVYEPFYIGKGTGTRYLQLNRNDSHRKIRTNLISKNLEIEPILLMEGLSEYESLSYESKLIDILGLKSLSSFGLLTNLDEGLNKESRRKLYSFECQRVINKNN